MSKKDKKEIERFLQGKSSARGEEIFNTWYNSFQDEKGELSLDQEEVQKEIELIKKREEVKIRKLAYPEWYKIAAAIIAILLVTGLLYFKTDLVNSVARPTEYAVNNVPQGGHQKIVLSDGTTVWLNQGSTLRYPKNFEGNTREVSLVGEAFFNVHRNVKKPFIIHTPKLSTKVLGTSFNIQAYSDRETEEVTVATGKVLVTENASAGSKVNLTPGQQVTYRHSSKEINVVHSLNITAIGSWRNGELIFDNTSVSEIISTLHQHYNVTVRLGDGTLAQQKVTADFSKLPLEKVLNLLSVTLNSCYTKQQDGYTLGSDECGN